MRVGELIKSESVDIAKTQTMLGDVKLILRVLKILTYDPSEITIYLPNLIN